MGWDEMGNKKNRIERGVRRYYWPVFKVRPLRAVEIAFAQAWLNRTGLYDRHRDSSGGACSCCRTCFAIENSSQAWGCYTGQAACGGRSREGTRVTAAARLTHLGCCQCVIPGMMCDSTSAMMSLHLSPLAGNSCCVIRFWCTQRVSAYEIHVVRQRGGHHKVCVVRVRAQGRKDNRGERAARYAVLHVQG